jgi:RNA polymerase sigma-70 factor (ECF subfamily)
VLSDTGRRLFERRGLLVAGGAPPLPARLRGCADRLLWFEHVGRRSSVTDDAQMARLVARFQSGDQEAFVELYLRCFDRVYGFLNVLLRDHHAAEDAAQQTFVKAYQALPAYQLRAETPFRAWLLRIARNEGLGHMRKLGRIAPEEPQQLDLRRDRACTDMPVDRLLWLSDADLMAFVQRLPEAQRQVLTLRFMMGLKTDELAQVLDRTPQAVRKLEHRAPRFLASRLQATRERPVETRLERVSSLRRLRRSPVLRARRFALALSTPAMYARPRAW